MKKLLAPGKDSGLTSFALLMLRCWLGATMLLHHGLDKLTHYGDMAQHFFDPLHIGSKASLALVVFAEVVCAAFLALGIATRLAALVLAIEMSVAFFLFHHQVMNGPHSGELAFIYLAGFVTLFLAGGGKFSMDQAVFGKGGKGGSFPARKD
ncbi:MAG: DoxX family protein [Verrucomicrobiota bacterium]|nr:DoxX family protein [Verrucomicrobiota bacterium]